MATTKKTTTTAKKATSTPKAKAVETEAINKELEAKNQELEEQKKVTNDLMAMVAQLQSQMAELKSNKAEEKKNSLAGKRIKLVSLFNGIVNIGTRVDGGGITKTFNKYGATVLVRFEDLEEMTMAYPNTFKEGLVYILDKDAVKELGLEEDYERINTKENIDKMLKLEDESVIDMFRQTETFMRNTLLDAVADRMAKGEKVDQNIVMELKKEFGVDLNALAEEKGMKA